MKKILTVLLSFSLINSFTNIIISCKNEKIKSRSIPEQSKTKPPVFEKNKPKNQIVPVPIPKLEKTKETKLKLKNNEINKYNLKNINKIFDINESIYKMHIDNKKNIYFGTNNGSYILKSDSKIPLKIENIYGEIKYIVSDNNGNVYFKGNFNVFVYENYSNKVYKLAEFIDWTEEIIDREIKEFDIDNEGNIYYSNNLSLFVLKYGNKKPIKISNLQQYILNIFIDYKNNIYIFTTQGIYKSEDNGKTMNKIIDKIILFKENNILLINNDKKIIYFDKKVTEDKILCYFFDNENNMFFITKQKLEFYYNPNNLYPTEKNKDKFNLFILKYNGNETIKIKEIENEVYSLLITDNLIYFGTNKGIYYLEK